MNERLAAVTSYHAHVYYTPETRSSAAAVRTGLVARFPLRMGRWRDEPVGPHPVPMFQVAFEPEAFGTILPWLMFNRRGHSILIHPLSNDAVADHLENMLWLGEPLPLRSDRLRPTAPPPENAR